MGADLIGYLVKGPLKITKELKEQAVRALLVAAEERRSTGVLICPDCDDEIEVNGFDGCCPNCGQEIGDPLVNIKTLKDARTYVDGFVVEWPPDGRDVTSRLDPDDGTQLLVFAGDMSWGDEPQGNGYQCLKSLMLSGVAKYLGIR